MFQAGVSNEGHSSSTAIRLSNDCKCVFNEVSPWSIFEVFFGMLVLMVYRHLQRSIGICNSSTAIWMQ